MPDNSLAEYCVTKTWVLRLSVSTSKAQLPYGFKRLQLSCYKPQQHPTKPITSRGCQVPHLRDREQGLLSTPVQGNRETVGLRGQHKALHLHLKPAKNSAWLNTSLIQDQSQVQSWWTQLDFPS